MKNQVKRLTVGLSLSFALLLPTLAAGQTFLTYPDTTPPWVSRWAVTNITPFAATINWTTNELSDAMIEFCPTWSHCNNFTPLVSTLSTDHVINLSGLLPAKRYYFRMYSRDQYGNQSVYGYKTFTTAWVPPTSTPTPLPTPMPTLTPLPSPFPSQTPVSTPDTNPPWTTGWSVANITPYSATVNWTTNEPSDSQLEFCTTWVHCGNFTPLLPALTTSHQINLSGLSPYTRYYVWMHSKDSAGNRMIVYTYRTFTTLWVPPTFTPTPLPTPIASPTPTPTPYPSQSPVATPDVNPPWVVRWTVSQITTNSALIEWITNEPSDGMVEICPSWANCANFTPRTNDNSTYHSALVSGLTASKRYFFWMYSRDAGGNQGIYGYKTFYTAWQ